MNKPSIKAVIFDLFGTLIENLPASEYLELLREIAGVLDVNPKPFTDLWQKYSDHRMIGTMNNADCFDIVCSAMGLSPDPEKLQAAEEIFNRRVELKMKVPDETVTGLSNILDLCYATGLASNCSDEVLLYWDATPLASKIQRPVFSCSAGFQKPQPEIYTLAAKRVNVIPAECIFVDDSADALNGAMRTGMTPVLIQNPNLKSNPGQADTWDGLTITSIHELPDLIYSLETK